jgi:CRISPR system Cascade subunit CasE
MNWITRAELRRDAPAQQALASLLLDASRPDVGHRLVWSLFADDQDANRDFLYREVEPGRFLIVSERGPSDPRELWRLETKPYAPRFMRGERMGFSLRANPAQSVKAAGRERGVRVDAVMHAKTLARDKLNPDEIEQAALDWLFAREARLGVRFDRPFCAAGGYRQVHIGRPGAKPIRHSVVDYEGALEVLDPAALARVAAGGVGKAKGYGCGLLMLRPLAT